MICHAPKAACTISSSMDFMYVQTPCTNTLYKHSVQTPCTYDDDDGDDDRND